MSDPAAAVFFLAKKKEGAWTPVTKSNNFFFILVLRQSAPGARDYIHTYITDSIVKRPKLLKYEKSLASSVSPQTGMDFPVVHNNFERVQLPSEAVLSPSLVRAYPFCPY